MSAISDADGYYTLSNIPIGHQTVKISYVGYATKTFDVVISDKQTTECDNGNRIPSAEGDTRNVQLDLIPADMIQMEEVKKVVTPDMDADAIGGSINLITKNSPYKRFITATAGSGYNDGNIIHTVSLSK